MALRFYMDVHVPWAVTAGLRRRGVDVLRAQDDGYDQAPDETVLDHAGQIGRVVFTMDQDFLAEAHKRQIAGDYFSGVVYAPQDNGPSIGQCIRDLEMIAGVFDPPDMENRVEYLPI